MPRLFLCPALALSLPLSLMACGELRQGNETTAVTVPDNGYSARMAALNEGERNAVLFRAIRDAGRDCQGVARSQTVDPVQGKPAWLASCEDDGQWLVVMGNDGIATVTNARELAGARRTGG